jgi:hypothetical protein
MIFVWSFAVGGAAGPGTERPFPTWALVSEVEICLSSLSLQFAQNPKGNPDYCLRLTKPS